MGEMEISESPVAIRLLCPLCIENPRHRFAGLPLLLIGDPLPAPEQPPQGQVVAAGTNNPGDSVKPFPRVTECEAAVKKESIF